MACYSAPFMVQVIAKIIEVIAVGGTLSSVSYYILCIWSAAGFLRQNKTAHDGARPTPATPPISILKPLKGTDPEMYESFRSHCLQDYSEFEIIFGVSDPNDPTVELVERLQREFPEVRIRLVICGERIGVNTKVSNLAQMLAEAHFEYLVVNDSDMRVESDYLRRVVAPLADSKIGLVTCLYRGVAGPTLGSRLESLGISTDFCAGVLAARELEGIRFGLGSTLVFRRCDLTAIGGFEALADYLADDYEIGRRIAERGLEVKLSEVVVETYLPAYTLRGFLEHQLRWARGVRDSRRAGYVGLLFTFGIFWALLALAAAGAAAWAWALLGIVLTFRFAMTLAVGKAVLRDRAINRWWWLIPLRDLVAVIIWLTSFTGHRVNWRGDRFELKDGRLVKSG